jgi:uncharacterized phage-associated protein
MKMQMTFVETKATQIAGRLLSLAGGRLQYLALIKLLYRLDREAINRWGMPVTTDQYVSMKLGPVTSHIYNLIKDSGDSAAPSFWSKHIVRDGYDAVLAEDPSDTELSRAEESLAAEIFAKDGAKDGFKLADECHKEFPEWEDPGSSSTRISLESILIALEKSEDEWAHAAASVSAHNTLHTMLVD